MEDDRKNRLTYCNKEEEAEQLMSQVVEDLRLKHPVCEAVLEAVANYDKLADHPDLPKMYHRGDAVLLTTPAS